MGFYPKHLKQRRQRQIAGAIARAALAGCTFLKSEVLRTTDRYNTYGFLIHVQQTVWAVRYPNGQHSFNQDTKSQAAALYMRWFLSIAKEHLPWR